jgi:hypothetical protein
MPGINLAFELETEAEAAARVARERLFEVVADRALR